MKYVVDSEKSVDQAATDLQEAVARHKFGVLHVYDIRETLKGKGIDFPNECRILEICNPKQAEKVLTEDMALNMALPCRVSVYAENGQTKIGMIRPTELLKPLSDSDVLATVANEVEADMKAMIDEAK